MLASPSVIEPRDERLRSRASIVVPAVWAMKPPLSLLLLRLTRPPPASIVPTVTLPALTT